MLIYPLQNQQITLGDYSPEKAGVGGSTPSLATMFSATYPLAFPHLGPLWVQFRPFTAHVLIGC